MESEKVKEIKSLLEIFANDNESDGTTRICREALTLINELESENERLSKKLDMWEKIICKKNDCIAELRKENGELLKENDELEKQCVKWSELDFKKRNKITELKDRIAELEKGNEALSFAVKQGFNDCQTKTLKQFAERLKEKVIRPCDLYDCVTLADIDETLKEFIGEKS